MKTLFIKGVSLEYRVITFALLSVCIMFADNRFDYLDRLRYSLGYVATPVYFVAHIPARMSFWIGDVFVSRTQLIEENTQLREQLLIAQRELQLQASLTRENNLLREMRSSAETLTGKKIIAEIINKSTDPGTQRFLIDKGATDGVYLNQAMLDADGLMGQVDEVMPYTSWVLLITDPHSSIPVQVNRNGERANARGSSGDVAELELEYVTSTQDIKVGDMLVSSGMGERFPKDYQVAQVISVKHDPGKPFVTIKAKPTAKFEKTRYVLLVDNNSATMELPENQAPSAEVPAQEASQLNNLEQDLQVNRQINPEAEISPVQQSNESNSAASEIEITITEGPQDQPLATGRRG